VLLVDFLRANADIFAWSPSDMPGILREVAEHSLDILPHSRAVQQRLRRFDEERRRVIGEELRKCDNPPRKIPYYRLRPIHFGH
jgi:hypothetical protein